MGDITRRDSWLENVNTLQLLCCVHKKAFQLWDPHDYKMRMMVYSSINTLAAPKLKDPPGNIMDLFAVIADPQSSQQRALRERYQRKEFAKQAVNSPESVGPKKGPPSKAEQNGQL